MGHISVELVGTCPRCRHALHFRDSNIAYKQDENESSGPFKKGDSPARYVKDARIPLYEFLDSRCACRGIFLAKISGGIFQGFELKEMTSLEVMQLLFDQGFLADSYWDWWHMNLVQSLYEDTYGDIHRFSEDCRAWLKPLMGLDWGFPLWPCPSDCFEGAEDQLAIER